ncbi:hypothetical protein [Siphonobacter sp. SORGH_AS_1065]|uniref:hypothetical protein n=1 Tax=Siphonobacter sp. SORGH_AS_1065 TaxID=3041795 RepID=UPI00278071F5|nr:hypothetical protein [Siphonobacter sp. SORGH_AS_1065]MDQ1088584.1 hypothetical protein [Siphonobacter sp. SORGH_AS_1065]
MFDFYYQSGEFGSAGSTDWWSVSATFFGSLMGAGIGAWGAYWVLKEGKRLEYKQREDDQYSFDLKNLKYFGLLIKESIYYVQSVCNECIKQSGIYKASDRTTFPPIYFLNDFNLERITKRINQEQLYHSYKNIIGNDNFNEIIIHIDYFYSQTEKLKVLIDKDLEENAVAKQTFLDTVQDVVNMLININSNKDLDEITEDKINKLIIKYYTKLYNDQYYYINMEKYLSLFIEPLSEVLSKNLDKHNIKEVYQLTTKATRFLIPIINKNNDSFVYIDSITNKLSENIEIFKPLVDDLFLKTGLNNETN